MCTIYVRRIVDENFMTKPMYTLLVTQIEREEKGLVYSSSILSFVFYLNKIKGRKKTNQAVQ